jgi:hypothetical protein
MVKTALVILAAAATPLVGGATHERILLRGPQAFAPTWDAVLAAAREHLDITAIDRGEGRVVGASLTCPADVVEITAECTRVGEVWDSEPRVSQIHVMRASPKCGPEIPKEIAKTIRRRLGAPPGRWTSPAWSL